MLSVHLKAVPPSLSFLLFLLLFPSMATTSCFGWQTVHKPGCLPVPPTCEDVPSSECKFASGKDFAGIWLKCFSHIKASFSVSFLFFFFEDSHWWIHVQLWPSENPPLFERLFQLKVGWRFVFSEHTKRIHFTLKATQRKTLDGSTKSTMENNSTNPPTQMPFIGGLWEGS